MGFDGVVLDRIPYDVKEKFFHEKARHHLISVGYRDESGLPRTTGPLSASTSVGVGCTAQALEFVWDTTPGMGARGQILAHVLDSVCSAL